jgi:hypothetical protein
MLGQVATQRQIESTHVNQLALENILASTQMHSPHTNRLIRMCEAACQQLSAPAQQSLL